MTLAYTRRSIRENTFATTLPLREKACRRAKLPTGANGPESFPSRSKVFGPRSGGGVVALLTAVGCGSARDAGTTGARATDDSVASAASPLEPLTSGPVRGTANDAWADVVLGKPDFTQIQQYRVVRNMFYIPEGVWIDRSRHSSGTQKMYVDDSGNNRILGYNWDSCIASSQNPLNCTPSIVLGQPNFISSGCNGDSGFQAWPNRAPASSTSLCTLQESQISVAEGGSGASMVTDASGTLYVADFFNNRVLKYIDPFATDTIADAVWGQANFTGNACNKGNAAPDATTLCFTWGNNNSWTAGVDLDKSGNLWVADSGNHRILRFPGGATTADLVIGESTFTATWSGSTNDHSSTPLNQLEDPVAIRFSPTTGNLYVADNGADNRRVVRFTPPFTTGMSGTVFAGAGTFTSPMGIDIDPAGRGLWITERDGTHAGTIQLWTETQPPTNPLVTTSPGDFRLSGSIGIDLAGNMVSASRLTSDPARSNNVTVFPASGAPPVPLAPTNPQNHGVFDSCGNQSDNASIGLLTSLDVSGNQLIAADGNRLLVWNSPGTQVSGAAATFAVATDYYVNSLKADPAGHTLWTVQGRGGGYDQAPFIIIAYALPISGSLAKVQEIDLTQPLLLAGGGTINLGGDPVNNIAPDAVMSIAPDAHGAVWITGGAGANARGAPGASRVVRIQAALSGMPKVDVVLGQADPIHTLCNRDYTLQFDDTSDRVNAQPNTLCAPGSVSIDPLGNVWVSDHSIELNGNLRVLEFDANLFQPPPSTPIYGPGANHIFPLAATFESAFDSTGHLVEGYNPYAGPPYLGFTAYPSIGNGHFSALYGHPLGMSPMQPDQYLNDFESYPYTAAFDSQGNFYAGDIDRSRILVYHGLPLPGGSDAGTDAAADAATDAAADAARDAATDAAADAARDAATDAAADAARDAATDAARDGATDAGSDAAASNGCASGATVISASACSSLPSFNTTGAVCVKVKVNTVNGWNASNVQGRTATAQGATTQGPITPTNGSIPNQPGLSAGSDGFVYFNFTAGQVNYTSMACW